MSVPPRVPFAPPSVSDAEIGEVVDTLRSDWLTTGPKTRQFEQEFSEFVEAPAAVALSSCTAGLHLALLAHGIGPGDEVITTCLTFAATVNVIEHIGARPVLVDVEPDTLCLDPRQVAAAVTPSTKAIIVVHYAGHPADMEAIEAIAGQHGLVIIEDAAHALPTEYRGRKIGASKNLTSFSFYATKNMTTGEGGMLTGCPELLDEVRVLALHGMSRNAWNRYSGKGSWQYDVAAPGFKYNMTDIQAAIGLHQLRRLGEFQARREEIVFSYREAFSSVPGLQLPIVRPEAKSAQHLFVLRLDTATVGIDRDHFFDEMKQRGVTCSVHFIPIHLHSFYRDKYNYCPEDFPIAYENFQRMVSLPLSAGLSDEQVSVVIDAVVELCANKQRMVA